MLDSPRTSAEQVLRSLFDILEVPEGESIVAIVVDLKLIVESQRLALIELELYIESESHLSKTTREVLKQARMGL